MNLEMLDVFFTTLIICPNLVKPSQYLTEDWAGIRTTNRNSTTGSREQAQYVMDLLMRHWNSIAIQLNHTFPPEPITIDYGGDNRGRDWAFGFLQGIELHNRFWDEKFVTGRKTASLVADIVMLLGEDASRNPVSPARRRNILAELPMTIRALRRMWRNLGGR